MTPSTGNPEDRNADVCLDSDWRETTIGSLLIAAAQRAADRPALQWLTSGGIEAFSWAQTLQAARRGVAVLMSDPGHTGPVAIFAPNCLGWCIALWSAALAGRPLVPINPNLTASEVQTILSDCAATTVLAARSYRGEDLVALVTALRSQLPKVTRVCDLDDWWDRQPQRALTDEATADHANPSDTSLIQYTSGTTGVPKGAVLSHRACVNAAATLAAALEPSEHEVWCSPMPLHHISGSIAHVMALACVAGTYVMLADFSAQAMVEAARLTGATVLAGVPTVYLRILDDPEMSGIRLPALRALMLGGASCPPNLVERIERHFAASVAILYGQSEAPAITQTRLSDDSWTKANTLGRALPHRELRIADTDTGQLLRPGEVGEICVRTAVSMDCYLNRPEATATTIDDDGWLHTGDLGSLDTTGLLQFHGRIREMIVRGGENVYAREVEGVIGTHPDVSQVAVVGMPDPHWGEIVVAVVVPRDGVTLNLNELQALAERELAYFKRPAQWHIAEALPTTASGKPQKFKIKQQLESDDGQ